MNWPALICLVYGVLLGMAGTLLVCAHLDVKQAKRRAAEIREMVKS